MNRSSLHTVGIVVLLALVGASVPALGWDLPSRFDGHGSVTSDVFAARTGPIRAQAHGPEAPASRYATAAASAVSAPPSRLVPPASPGGALPRVHAGSFHLPLLTHVRLLDGG